MLWFFWLNYRLKTFTIFLCPEMCTIQKILTDLKELNRCDWPVMMRHREGRLWEFLWWRVYILQTLSINQSTTANKFIIMVLGFIVLRLPEFITGEVLWSLYIEICLESVNAGVCKSWRHLNLRSWCTNIKRKRESVLRPILFVSIFWEQQLLQPVQGHRYE